MTRSTGRRLLALALSTFAVIATARADLYTPPSSPRTDMLLADGWRFLRADAASAQDPAFDDSAWATVSVPHTWNGLDGQDGGSNYYRGPGWYRNRFWLDAATAGRRIYLKFEGVSLVADVYVNGTPIGQHRGAFAAFVFDITDACTPGAWNSLAVRASNASTADVAPLSGDFNICGGIHREVHVLTTSPLHIDPLNFGSPGVFLRTTQVSAASAELAVDVDIRNATAETASATLTAHVVAADGTAVARLQTAVDAPPGTSRATLATTITSPHLWDGVRDPYLYHVWIELAGNPAPDPLQDLVVQPLGFRFFAVDPMTGFHLNGRSYPLRGVSLHQDWPDRGWATGPAERARNIALLQEIGANFVRLAHYQHPPETYDLLDRTGIAAWAEIPLVNQISAAAAFHANTRQQLTELILQNFNHPSVLMWGLHNEPTSDTIPVGQTAYTIPLLHQLARTLDPGRPTTAAMRMMTAGSSLDQSTDLIGWNYYYGWYTQPITGFGSACDRFHTTYPSRPVGVSEYGAGASILQHAENPPAPKTNGPWHPEEYQALYHESHWRQIATRPYLWCTVVWNMFDFAVDSRNEGDTRGRNDKGLVTYDRTTRKDAFYFYQAQWTTAPMVHLCSQRFTPRTATPIEIKVYSNCDTVELVQNGVSLGTKTSTDRVFRWTGVNLALGANDFQAIATSTGATVTDQVVTTFAPPAGTAPIALSITPDSAGFRLSFPSAPGQRYQVETTTDLTTGAWLLLTDVIVGTGAEMVVVDPGGAVSARFYRVRILP